MRMLPTLRHISVTCERAANGEATWNLSLPHDCISEYIIVCHIDMLFFIDCGLTHYASRNIVVYSAEHALTIEHGQGKSGGINMMVSYHENDHYNSVRDNSVAKPPPPVNIKRLTNIESSQSGDTEAILEEPDIDGEIKKPEETVTEPSMSNEKPVKKNAPCPCGSGLRYRKCCWKINKSKERSRTWKQKRGLTEESDNEENTVAVDGNFKVLKI
jgi:SEC-C motif